MQKDGQWEPGASLSDAAGLTHKEEKEATLVHNKGHELEAGR